MLASLCNVKCDFFVIFKYCAYPVFWLKSLDMFFSADSLKDMTYLKFPNWLCKYVTSSIFDFKDYKQNYIFCVLNAELDKERLYQIYFSVPRASGVLLSKPWLLALQNWKCIYKSLVVHIVAENLVARQKFGGGSHELLCTIRFRSSSKSGSLPLSHDAVSSFSRLRSKAPPKQQGFLSPEKFGSQKTCTTQTTHMLYHSKILNNWFACWKKIHKCK